MTPKLARSAYFFHVVPVCDDAVLNWVLKGQDTSFALCFITNITVFLAHTHHHTLTTDTKTFNIITSDKWNKKIRGFHSTKLNVMGPVGVYFQCSVPMWWGCGKFTWCLGRPTMEGNTARGASSPAKPALHSPEPLSHTRAVLSSSSHMVQLGFPSSLQQETITADASGKHEKLLSMYAIKPCLVKVC